MKKQIKTYAIIFTALATTTIIGCHFSKPQVAPVQSNVVNDLKAYQHPDSIAKYKVGGEFNPVKVK